MIFETNEKLILASNSPRRKTFLNDLGLVFIVQAEEIDETPYCEEQPVSYVERMALEKAKRVSLNYPDCFVLAADTAVCVGSVILGKPENKNEAVEMLMQLSGRTHVVRSAFCLTHLEKGILEVRSVATEVSFTRFSKDIATAYVEVGESLDKAGGYGIQSKGSFLVRKIEGSYSNVVGLPQAEVVELLKDRGVISVKGQ